MSYLYAAYAITWLIHLGYIGTLVRRYSRLQRELQDLKRDS
ncbi:MAG: CcmD family protein [Acidobacteriaceae bacterium]|nr:CcmD family protein [Acidobacteriaceae bacterium]